MYKLSINMEKIQVCKRNFVHFILSNFNYKNFIIFYLLSVIVFVKIISLFILIKVLINNE